MVDSGISANAEQMRPLAWELQTDPQAGRAIGTASLWTAFVLTAAFGAGHFTSSWNFTLDLVANLSYLAAWPLAGLLLIAALTHRYGLTLAAMLGILVATMPLLRSYVSTPSPAAAGSRPVSILMSNLQGKETAWERLRFIINERQPDIIVLVEADPPVVRRVLADDPLLAEYAFSVTPKPGLSWSIIILSRFPFQPLNPDADPSRFKFLFSFRRASVVSLPFGEAILTAEHPPSPRTRQAWALGNQQLLLLSELVRQQFADTGLPVIVAGDFNSTPSGYRSQLLRDNAGLHGDPLGLVPRGTWPNTLPAFWRLPLDRVWVSSSLTFASREVLADIGSDHLPILVTITRAKPN